VTESIDVRSTETGTWSVISTDSAKPLSTHETESAAEQAARAVAVRRDAKVIIHDRYERVHEMPVDRWANELPVDR
jgi:hypothetical protein